MTFLRLHVLDETPHPHLKPLLSVESLRRLAWAVWFLDATIDGGNFGFSTIWEGAMTIQLPCDERPFMLHQTIPTEPLIRKTPSHTLGLPAHLLRAMHARQFLADAHSRIQRKLVDEADIPKIVADAESRAKVALDTLPPEMSYNRVQYHAYRDQRPMLVHLHVMRNNCSRHISLLRILAAPHIPQGVENIPTERNRLIQDARQLSVIFADAEHHQVILDPQMAMHAYNAIESRSSLACGR